MSTAQTSGIGVTELRIHGVGGSPGERMLGLEHSSDAVVVARSDATRFIARRDDRKVEGYEWGRLTSSSPLYALWVFLLPFTLMNAAGWMHPPSDTRRTRVIRALVHVESGLLTAAYTNWLAILLGGVIGYRWLSAHIGHVNLPFDWHLSPTAVGVVGLVAAFLCMISLMLIAGRMAKPVETVTPTTNVGHVIDPGDVDGWSKAPRFWSSAESLDSLDFFSHRKSARRLQRTHVGICVLTLCAGGLSWWHAHDIEAGLARLLLVIGAAQLALALVLGIASFRAVPDGQRQSVRMRPPAVSVLAIALSNGFLSGLVLLARRGLGVEPRVGQESLLSPAFTFTVLAWLITGVTAVFISLRWHYASTADLPTQTTPPETPPDGITPRMRARVSFVRGLSATGRVADSLIGLCAMLFWVIAVAYGLWLWSRASAANPLEVAPSEPSSWVMGFGVWLLIGVALVIALAIRGAAVDSKRRKAVGILWDVLAFWHRRFHPFCVRPYSEQAVPEFQRRIAGHIIFDSDVVVVAHSQGSVLASAALMSLASPRSGVDGIHGLKHVALVTYGCPISTFYSAMFPAYFGSQATEPLAKALAGRWHNFFRLTDPIGDEVSAGGGCQVVNKVLPDPATTESVAPQIPGQAPLEFPRGAWLDIAGHSHYLNEPMVHAAIAQLKGRIASAESRVATDTRVGSPES